MRHVRLLVLLLIAFAAGIGLVIACSDDAPADVDAASCDCEGFEPTIDAARLYTRRNVVDNGGGGDPAQAEAQCDEGDILLGGGCWIFRLGTPWDGSGSSP